jgi:hypothetical protein
VLGKLSADGLSEAAGTGTAVPLPTSVIVCGDPEALSAIVIAEGRFAAVCGLNATVSVHEAPAATLAPQPFARV